MWWGCGGVFVWWRVHMPHREVCTAIDKWLCCDLVRKCCMEEWAKISAIDSFKILQCDLQDLPPTFNSYSWSVPTLKITHLWRGFKWENLHNQWLTKYFFATLYVSFQITALCIWHIIGVNIFHIMAVNMSVLALNPAGLIWHILTRIPKPVSIPDVVFQFLRCTKY